MDRSPVQLLSLNHISRVCRDVATTRDFYRDVLGFFEVKRPSAFNFDGFWLFGYGVGLHLIHGCPSLKQRDIDPRADHVSFVANDLDFVEQKLRHCNIPTVRQVVHEGGVEVSQVFFHDPDHNMIEICNCNCLPVIPLSEIRSPQEPSLAQQRAAEWLDEPYKLRELESLQLKECGAEATSMKHSRYSNDSEVSHMSVSSSPHKR